MDAPNTQVIKHESNSMKKKKIIEQRHDLRQLHHLLEHLDSAQGALLRKDTDEASGQIAMGQGLLKNLIERNSNTSRKTDRHGG